MGNRGSLRGPRRRSGAPASPGGTDPTAATVAQPPRPPPAPEPYRPAASAPRRPSVSVKPVPRSSPTPARRPAEPFRREITLGGTALDGLEGLVTWLSPGA